MHNLNDTVGLPIYDSRVIYTKYLCLYPTLIVVSSAVIVNSLLKQKCLKFDLAIKKITHCLLVTLFSFKFTLVPLASHQVQMIHIGDILPFRIQT